MDYKCYLHKQQPAIIYCELEGQMYCDQCLHMHDGHGIVGIEAYKEQHSNANQLKYAQLTYSKKCLSKLKNNINNFINVQINIVDKQMSQYKININTKNPKKTLKNEKYKPLIKQTNKKIQTTIENLIKGLGKQFNNDTVYYYDNNTLKILDTDNKKIKKIIINLPANPRASSISIENKIYFIGGGGAKQQTEDTMIEYDVNTGVLCFKKQMINKKNMVSLTHYKNYILCIGGYKEESKISTNECEKYDIRINNWSRLPPLTFPRSSCATTTVKNNIYAFAGDNYYDEEHHFLNSVEKTMIGQYGWECINIINAPIERTAAHGMTINDNIIVYGGKYYEGKKWIHE